MTGSSVNKGWYTERICLETAHHFSVTNGRMEVKQWKSKQLTLKECKHIENHKEDVEYSKPKF